jgi:signal recognition particle receptor subunit beta
MRLLFQGESRIRASDPQMAVIDPERGDVVVRIVYDGPPFAGKTTSVRALARHLGGEVVVPEEIAGRTLYFDWLSYTGGLFEGRRIRCQIVSVPGQAALAARRRHLLETADAVVFVSESSQRDMPTVKRCLAGLRGMLDEVPGPPIGVVLQANKRDSPDAVPLGVLQTLLDSFGARIAIVQSVATDGVGVREAFVFAVRLALDRVRELMRANALKSELPEVDSADALLRELHRREGDSFDADARSGLLQAQTREPDATDPVENALRQAIGESRADAHGAFDQPENADSAPPRLPSEDLPSGMIWPPVHGRVILHAAMAMPFALKRQPNGDWVGIGDAWYLHSPGSACFGDPDAGHEALVAWARLHAGSAQVISSERCIALCDDGAGRYRLWQLVRIERSLRDEFSSALGSGPDAIAKTFLTVVRAFVHATERFAGAACWLPLSLRNLGVGSGAACFLGHMPGPQNTRPPSRRSLKAVLNLLALQLEYARPDLQPMRGDICAALDERIRADDSVPLDATHELARRFFGFRAA